MRRKPIIAGVRVLKCQRAIVAALGLLAGLIASPMATAAGPSAEAALKLTPIQKDDIEYDQPTAAEISKCTIAAEKIDGKTGWVVRDAQSRILRRFVDTNGDNVVDQWCYYRGGIEVYRDIDSNFNGKADQYRWLNTAGRRWGMDQGETGRITAWKAISAEEASAELVEAIAKKDERRFRALMLTSDELRDLGLGDATTKPLVDKITAAPNRFKQYIARPTTSITPKSQWIHFAAAQPGTVPAGFQGSTKDLLVYENVAAMVETDGKQSLLNVGTMIAVGDSWRLIDSPAGDSEATAEVSGGGYFFQVSLRNAAAGGTATVPNDPANEESQKLLTTLDGIEKSITAASDADKPALNEKRADVLDQLMTVTKDAPQRDAWGHQLADTISAAVQAGTYPEGVKRLEALNEKLAKDAANPALLAYVRYRTLMADYSQSMQKSGGDFGKVQAAWLKGLEKYVQDYPQSPDTPEAMLQIGVAQEFAGEEDKAKEWYAKVTTNFGDTPVAKKAAGARRRLESVGQVITLRGTDLNNRVVDLSRYKGRVVLIEYWATWCEPCKADMDTLRDLVSRFGKQGFSIIGINLDNDRQLAVDFLQKSRLPWVNLYEPGGLESRLATELGVLTLPTMLLVDQQGKVVNRSIHATQIEKELRERLKVADTPADKAAVPVP
ncbi:MAG: redoxin family protein [Planctomycetia bacterium]|nr:redoxin family protein [Planctomycetia bacterium]